MSEVEGSLMIAWQIKNKYALVIGAGDVANGRIQSLLAAGALVTVIAEEICHDNIRELASSNKITYIQSKFESRYLDQNDHDNYNLVLSAINDREGSFEIYLECQKRKIPVNIADMPSECDFYFGSMIQRGPLQVMVSTNGKSPRLAKRIREELEHKVDELNLAGAITNMGKLRQALREVASGFDQQTIRSRMKWISDLTDDLTFNQIASITDHDIEYIVSRYPHKVTYQELLTRH